MRFTIKSTAARLALAAASSCLLLTGCASSFATGNGYDEQACVERALRRTTDLESVALATKKFEEECGNGGAEACSALGVIYERGVGVKTDPSHAVALYGRACFAGNQHGCANLGIARANGLVAAADVTAGALLLEPACIGGDARACAYLGKLYLTGDGVPKNQEHAIHLLEHACDGEEAAACLAVGDVLTTVNLSEDAARFYGQGCLNGSAAACGRIGLTSSRSREEVAAVERR